MLLNVIDYFRKKKILWFFLKSYFYISGFFMTLYPFWFGIDSLNNSKFQSLKAITNILKEKIFWILIPSLIGLFLKYIVDELLANKFKSLEKENEKLNQDLINYSEALKDLSKDILRDFSKEKLNSETGEQMRVSLYVKNKAGHLYCLGRYSKNSDYSDFSHTTIYKEKGIIVKSWIDGNDNGYGKFDNGFPDISNLKKYKKYQLEKYQLTGSDVDKMKMKSHLYYSYRVEYNSEKLGVILIESISRTKYTGDFLNGIIRELENRITIVLKSTFEYLDAPKTYSSNQI